MLEFFKKRLTIKIPIWLMILSFLFVYLVWEAYWYSIVGLMFIKWHTHLMFYVYGFLLIFLLLLVVFIKRKKILANALLICGAIFFSLILLESFLIVNGRMETYLEKIGGSYFSPYTTEHDSHYHVWPTDEKEHWLDKPEYKFKRPTNTLGFPDYEWSLKKKDGTIRVFCIGDSFTEGDGALYDSSYPSILKQLSIRDSLNVEIFNAGVCGSDPFFDFKVLKDKLIAFQPDIVIQTLSTQDLFTDILLRGGEERFSEEVLKYKKAPWWEFIYAVSYVSRIGFRAFGINELLRKKGYSEEEKEMLNKQLNGLFKEYLKFCDNNNITLLVLLRPGREEIMEGNFEFDFSKIIAPLNEHNDVKVYDLLTCFSSYIDSSNSDVKQFFWKYDGHHNSNGYVMMAKCIYPELYQIVKEE